MDIKQVIASYSEQPLTHQLLVSLLKDYKRPNDKIKALKTDGIIEPVKRGLYISGKAVNSGRPENGLLANHILGPSYVSMDSALSYYGLIPEKVFVTTSMTTKASREFDTSAGLFTYTYLPLPYYAFGLNTVKFSENQMALMASPEKALCDKIVTTPGIILRSVSSAVYYLLDDLRMDESDLKKLDTDLMLNWLEATPKKDSIAMVIKMIDKL